MQAVVPAAGRGSRLGALTADRPKPLVPVGGTPLVEHVLDALAPAVSEYVVVVGYRGDRLRSHLGDRYADCPVTYVEQAEPRGLADALLCAAPAVDGPFLHCNADNVFAADLSRLATHREATDADAVLLTERVSEDVARETGVLVRDEAGLRVVEKPDDPPSLEVQTGAFAFSPAVFDACRAVDPSARGEYELSDAVTRLARDGRVETLTLAADEWRVNVNTAADIAAAERRLR
ncbi:sugar phosphate nucleotidyltransferase [Salinirubellus salinus]|uniref:Sugar phosphate nucleotidyltransferase n=1 Tax=Salinirubellus salinus TaxID=1364945 RepID=A0A9E7UCK5_9EURY|nr:sugar phosphate nucleotidyltransferase [Salinirubellus salinus]UWM56358.1 sugar phosphate nucleotidyltransferase [Salinirubellus salinus]